MNTRNDFQLRDVTLRDGLQLTGGMLSTERKASIVRSLLHSGVPAIEIGSMARPDLVPPMANTIELIGALTAEELEKCWIWVATPRHVQKAAAAGAVNMQYCLSVSDAHNQANLGRSTEASMAALPQALEHARDAGANLQLCLATSFTCPFEGDIDPGRVLKLVEDPRGDGVSDVVICDTLGHAVPEQVHALIRTVKTSVPEVGVVFHGHDTWGMGVANAIAALDAGATTIDGALGGLGGCPFAPGASGNTSTEDLLFGLRPGWLNPGNFAELVLLGEGITSELGEENRSKSARGSRSKATAFQWVMPN